MFLTLPFYPPFIVTTELYHIVIILQHIFYRRNPEGISFNYLLLRILTRGVGKIQEVLSTQFIRGLELVRAAEAVDKGLPHAGKFFKAGKSRNAFQRQIRQNEGALDFASDISHLLNKRHLLQFFKRYAICNYLHLL